MTTTAQSTYYILEGHEARPEPDLMTWGFWFSDIGNRRVAETKVEGIHVSTVFLGSDHQFGNGPPLLFETMIFSGEAIPELDEWQDRYSTWAEAEEGHARAVALVNDALNGRLPEGV